MLALLHPNAEVFSRWTGAARQSPRMTASCMKINNLHRFLSVSTPHSFLFILNSSPCMAHCPTISKYAVRIEADRKEDGCTLLLTNQRSLAPGVQIQREWDRRRKRRGRKEDTLHHLLAGYHWPFSACSADLGHLPPECIPWFRGIHVCNLYREHLLRITTALGSTTVLASATRGAWAAMCTVDKVDCACSEHHSVYRSRKLSWDWSLVQTSWSSKL